MSMRKLVTIVGWLLWTAEVSLSLATDGARSVSAHWLLRVSDQIDAHTCADDLRALLDAVVPWMGLGATVGAAPAQDETLRATHHFRPGPMEVTTVVNRVSPPWRFTRGDGRPWRLEITLGGPAILDEADAPAAPWVRARVTLFGSGPRADLMANLLAEAPWAARPSAPNAPTTTSSLYRIGCTSCSPSARSRPFRYTFINSRDNGEPCARPRPPAR